MSEDISGGMASATPSHTTKFNKKNPTNHRSKMEIKKVIIFFMIIMITVLLASQPLDVCLLLNQILRITNTVGNDCITIPSNCFLPFIQSSASDFLLRLAGLRLLCRCYFVLGAGSVAFRAGWVRRRRRRRRWRGGGHTVFLRRTQV